MNDGSYFVLIAVVAASGHFTANKSMLSDRGLLALRSSSSLPISSASSSGR
jgi:hypothetical protein